MSVEEEIVEEVCVFEDVDDVMEGLGLSVVDGVGVGLEFIIEIGGVVEDLVCFWVFVDLWVIVMLMLMFMFMVMLIIIMIVIVMII